MQKRAAKPRAILDPSVEPTSRASASALRTEAPPPPPRMAALPTEAQGVQLHMSQCSATGYVNVRKSGRKYAAFNNDAARRGVFDSAEEAAVHVARHWQQKLDEEVEHYERWTVQPRQPLEGPPGAAGQYYAERILERRLVPGRAAPEYKVRWLGYAQADDTWEPEQHVAGTPALERFLAARVPIQDCRREPALTVEGIEAAVVDGPEDGEEEVVEAVVVEAAPLDKRMQAKVKLYTLLLRDATCDACGGTWPAGAMPLHTLHTITNHCRHWHGIWKGKGKAPKNLEKLRRNGVAKPCRRSSKYAHLLLPPASGAWPDKYACNRDAQLMTG